LKVLYLLVCRICLMILFSSCFSSVVVIYVSFLLCNYLIAVNLCSAGWHESAGMIVSVVVGFRYILH
jgi:ABC-type multidrug transport system permease subunit